MSIIATAEITGATILNVVGSLANNVNGVVHISNNFVEAGQVKSDAWLTQVKIASEMEVELTQTLRDRELSMKISTRSNAIDQQLKANPELKTTYDQVYAQLKEIRARQAQALQATQAA